jgi:hypothetical protein
MQKFDTPAPISAVLDIPAGRVQFIAADRADTAVVGRLAGAAEISTGKGDISVAEAVRGTVVLRTEAGEISVGAAPGVSAALDASTAYGRISNGLKNDGAAQLDIHATTSYGDIVARSL